MERQDALERVLLSTHNGNFEGVEGDRMGKTLN